MSAPVGRMAKLRGALSSATRKVASGAKVATGKLVSGAKVATGKFKSAAASAATRASGAYAILPSIYSWPVGLLLGNVFLAALGFYMYLGKYNKFRYDSFTVDGKLPIFEIHSHMNVIIFMLLSLVWTFSLYYMNNMIIMGDFMKIARIFVGLFAGITQLYLFGMFYWLFTGASEDNANDLKADNKETDLLAAKASDTTAKACSTACAGDRTDNATTISADCPNGTCP